MQVLQANFQLDSNPDGQDLERIAQITGLSKRVTQVWFQNSRARQKKQQQQTGSHSSPGSGNIEMESEYFSFLCTIKIMQCIPCMLSAPFMGQVKNVSL